MHSWTPPPDLEKPACPYQPGFCVDIRAYCPLPPFGNDAYGPGNYPTWPSDEFYASGTQTDLVLAYPPVETLTVRKTRLSARLNIITPLAIGDGRGAQLAGCTVALNAPGKKPFKVVAKIFDPLYYSYVDGMFGDMPVFVTFYADRDYSHEAAAYEHLQEAGMTGGFVPEYYGSWTFTLPIRHGNATLQRSVRLILMEWIPGPTMFDLCKVPGGPPYDDAYRLEIMARVMDCAVRLLHAGVNHGDITPRNIILAGLPPVGTKPQTYPRIVLIDYNQAIVFERTIYRKQLLDLHKRRGLPKNPAEHYRRGLRIDFHEWLPRAWDANQDEFQKKWLADRFGGENASAYAPITEESDGSKSGSESESESESDADSQSG